MREFFQGNAKGKKIEKIILSGGGAMMVNLADYISKRLDLQVIIGDPFSRLTYPDEMKPIIDEVGPKLAVAAGLALREIS